MQKFQVSTPILLLPYWIVAIQAYPNFSIILLSIFRNYTAIKAATALLLHFICWDIYPIVTISIKRWIYQDSLLALLFWFVVAIIIASLSALPPQARMHSTTHLGFAASDHNGRKACFGMASGRRFIITDNRQMSLGFRNCKISRVLICE